MVVSELVYWHHARVYKWHWNLLTIIKYSFILLVLLLQQLQRWRNIQSTPRNGSTVCYNRTTWFRSRRSPPIKQYRLGDRWLLAEEDLTTVYSAQNATPTLPALHWILYQRTLSLPPPPLTLTEFDLGCLQNVTIVKSLITMWLLHLRVEDNRQFWILPPSSASLQW